MMNTTNAAATNAAISARILAAVAAGKNIREAIDDVLGAGVAANLIDELYTALRAGK